MLAPRCVGRERLREAGAKQVDGRWQLPEDNNGEHDKVRGGPLAYPGPPAKTLKRRVAERFKSGAAHSKEVGDLSGPGRSKIIMCV